MAPVLHFKAVYMPIQDQCNRGDFLLLYKSLLVLGLWEFYRIDAL